MTTARQGKGKSPSAGRGNGTLLDVGRDEPSLGRRGLLSLHFAGVQALGNFLALPMMMVMVTQETDLEFEFRDLTYNCSHFGTE